VTRGTLRVVLHQETGGRAHGTCAGPGAVLSREVGTGAAVKRGALGAALRGPGVALSQKVGSRAAVTHGGPGVVLSREVGTGATVTHGAPELPRVGR
jgi:hypothetical protein